VNERNSNKSQKSNFTCSRFTGGTPRSKTHKHHATALRTPNVESGCNRFNNGLRAPWLRTRSLKSGESPTMFPIRHAACSKHGKPKSISADTNNEEEIDKKRGYFRKKLPT